MRRVILGAVLSLALINDASAQFLFKRCFSAKEIEVEQLVRHGIFLRESSNRCEESTPGVAKMWKDFDTNFGQRLKAQTDRRAKIFQREFKEKELQVRTYFDGRLVTYHRNQPVTIAYCQNVKKLLTDLGRKGWGAFNSQAILVQNEVLLDIKKCP